MLEGKNKKIGHMNTVFWDKTESPWHIFIYRAVIWSFYDFSLENDYNFLLQSLKKNWTIYRYVTLQHEYPLSRQQKQ